MKRLSTIFVLFFSINTCQNLAAMLGRGLLASTSRALPALASTAGTRAASSSAASKCPCRATHGGCPLNKNLRLALEDCEAELRMLWGNDRFNELYTMLQTHNNGKKQLNAFRKKHPDLDGHFIFHLDEEIQTANPGYRCAGILTAILRTPKK